MEREKNAIIHRIAEAIYPEINLPADERKLGEVVRKTFEDMELSFYVKDSSGNKLYVRQKLKETLEECGIDVEEAAFLNYRRDAEFRLYTKNYCIKGLEIEVTVVFGNLCPGSILMRKESREELSKALPGSYVVVAILPECIVMAKETEGLEQEHLSVLRNMVVEGAESDRLSKWYYRMEEGELNKLFADKKGK